jgi:hypothetical protein
MYTPLNSRTLCIEIIEKPQNINAKKTIKISRNFTNIQCHAILIIYSVYQFIQLYVKLVDS